MQELQTIFYFIQFETNRNVENKSPDFLGFLNLSKTSLPISLHTVSAIKNLIM